MGTEIVDVDNELTYFLSPLFLDQNLLIDSKQFDQERPFAL